MHWCGFHAAKGESKRRIGLLAYCDVLLLKQLLPYICQAAGDFYFPVHHVCTRAPSCCDTRLRTSHQTCGLPIDQTSICRLQDTDSHSRMHLSETAMSSYITDKLWLLTKCHYISQGRVETPRRRGGQFCYSFVANLL